MWVLVLVGIGMKVLFPAVRVGDLETSLAFYEAVDLEVVGRVGHASTRMAMLALPREEEVILELVERTDAGPVSAGGLDHLAIQVHDLDATRRELLGAGLHPGEVCRPGGADGPRTVTLVDPDGHHLELVQWPDGHTVAHDVRRLRRPDQREGPMTAIRLDMTMSLDGFCAGPDDRPGQEMGRGGFRLFNWLDYRHEPGPNHDVYADSLATGAIISGRRTFELAGRWNGDHHDGVPILVLTHHVDEGDVPPGTARFHTDVAACAADARAGAGDRDVMVHGAGAGQALIRAGELDEIEVHIAPRPARIRTATSRPAR